jgi:hypothetical protein
MVIYDKEQLESTKRFEGFSRTYNITGISNDNRNRSLDGPYQTQMLVGLTDFSSNNSTFGLDINWIASSN